jgi:hypothetical protein
MRRLPVCRRVIGEKGIQLFSNGYLYNPPLRRIFYVREIPGKGFTNQAVLHIISGIGVNLNP